MAFTVDSAFNVFNMNSVNLNPDRTKTARSSRDWLISQLERLPNTVAAFPRLYEGMHIKFGSFARDVKILPLNDIDLILTFAADGTTYTEYIYGKYYKLNVANSNSNLLKLASDDGSLNSTKLVNKIISSIKPLSTYSEAAIHKRGEAATLKLISYEWNFDIVPAFFTTEKFYLIPDGSGNWKATDPRVDQNNTTTVNQKHNGQILQIIRTIKYWQKRSTMPTMSSYLLEVIILQYFNSQVEIPKYLDVNLINFWYHLKTAIYQSIQDPKGFSGELNNLSYEDRLKISNKAHFDYSKGLEAYNLEIKEGNQEKSIKKWAEIFGGEFPTYG